MPSASRNERRKHRIRRNLTLTKRIAQREALGRLQATTYLLTILAANGGEVEISQEALDSAFRNLGKAQYVVEKKNPESEPFDGLLVVRLVTTTEPVQESVREPEVVMATVNGYEAAE